MSRKGVLVIGHQIVDSVAFVEEEFIHKHNLPKGKVVAIGCPSINVDEIIRDLDPTKLQKSCGGSAMNAARWLALMGCSVSAMGKCGNDEGKKILLDNLKELGIENLLITYDNAPTMEIYCLVTPDTDRTMFGYYSASQEQFNKPIDITMCNRFQIILTEGYQFEIPEIGMELFPLIREFRRTGGKNVFMVSGLFKKPGYREVIMQIIDQFHVITGNLEEFLEMYQKKSKEELLQFLEQSGHELCAVTMGEEGSYLVKDGKSTFFPAPKVDKVVDTTGAGDGYAAGLVYGYLNEYSVEQISELANFCAGYTIAKVGAGLDSKIRNVIKPVLDKISKGSTR